mmetsp:Transcript_31867/g.76057  ORF Transcript_31867/g.76057 Transcript_31867/m.76057 type:complete len:549 (-) Transcript_31867:62-1708(-)
MMNKKSLKLPTIGSRQMPRSQMSTARSGQTDRFTKLKGVLVNNLLKEYHKQTNRQGDELVYNRAVEEVDKILQNGKLTEQQLVELQKNFAKGVMINPPMRRGQAPSKATMKPAPPPIAEDTQVLHGTGQVQDIRPPGTATAAKPPAMDDSVSVADSMMTESSPSKRRRAVDEWSIITLYNDVKHYEEQKVHKDRAEHDKKQTRQELQQQMEAKKQEKEARKRADRQAAQEQQAKYEQWKAERQRQDQVRQAKILAERDQEAKELQRMQDRKKLQADRDLKEQQKMLDEFQRQINEEKAAKERQLVQKQAQYQQMLVENAKVLERKRLAKEAEREENIRLFQLQVEMAEKQDRLRAEREAERQSKLKSAERMAGELNDRAGELEAQLEDRIRRAQEEHKRKELERDRMKREQKKARDSEMASVLQAQVREREMRKMREAEEQREIAARFRADADEYAKFKNEEKMGKLRSQQAVKDQLNQQLLMKEARKHAEGAMSTIELRLNSHLLKEVLDTGSAAVPDDLAAKIQAQAAVQAERDRVSAEQGEAGGW